VRIQVVLFDATGTLIEVREPVGERYAQIAAAHGVERPAQRLDEAFRQTTRHSTQRHTPGVSPSEAKTRERAWWYEVVHATFRAVNPNTAFADFDTFFDELFRSYASAEAWQLRAGARQCLASLAEHGLRMGVVSNFDYRLTDVLESLEIAEFFETVTLPGEHGTAKPDPRLFAAALGSMGASAATTIFVGDDPARDLAGARRAGITAVDVSALATLAELPAHLATLGNFARSPNSMETR
jgi:putative hydrolase of the HAD superfamily